MDPSLPPSNPTPPPAKIGRPPQWTESRSRKLARLYMYTTLPIKKIIKVLEDGGFKPGPNSAQKTLHNMLGHDPRYLRPENREEMNARIDGLSASNSRRERNSTPPQPDITADAPGSRSRAGSGPSQRPASVREMLDEAVSLGNPGQPLPEALTTFKFEPPSAAQSPFGHSQASPQMSPLQIDTTWSNEGSVAYGSPPGIVESQSSYQAAIFTPRSLNHTATMFSASTTASTPSLRNLKQRMSESSTTFARQVSALIRQWTIGSDTNLSRSLITTTDYHAQRAGAATIKPLPGEFFTAYSASEHEPTRWQEVLDVLSGTPNFWVTPDGKLSESAKRHLLRPDRETFSIQDCFGNTLLHLLASYTPDLKFVLQMAKACTAQQLCIANTAGQTFLHVLTPEWFQNLQDPSAPLLELLFHVRGVCPAMVAQCDVYGRTFYHHFQSMVSDSALVSIVLQQTCDPNMMPRRDAFDKKPIIEGAAFAAATGGPRHTQALSPLPEEVIGSPVSASSNIQQMDMFTQHHAGLLRTVNAAHTNPAVEDACGRNGLHCLAEVVLGDEDTLQERHSTLNSYRPPKRKYDQRNGSGSVDGSGGDGAASSPDEGPAAQRLGYLRGLMACPGMDANHYDRCGNTALMAFIERLTDQEEDRRKTLTAMLQLLISPPSGRGARVEARNARGETALLLAARLGRKTAVKVLLERGGANVHARDGQGKGALEIIDEACPRAKGDTPLYGRLQACRVLLTGRYRDDWVGGDEVRQRPTVLDEWRVRRARASTAVVLL